MNIFQLFVSTWCDSHYIGKAFCKPLKITLICADNAYCKIASTAEAAATPAKLNFWLQCWYYRECSPDTPNWSLRMCFFFFLKKKKNLQVGDNSAASWAKDFRTWENPFMCMFFFFTTNISYMVHLLTVSKSCGWTKSYCGSQTSQCS